MLGMKAVYHDKKNGYFVFAPPTGWAPKEYSDPRTKVAFHNPTDHEVYILLIVEEAQGDTFQEIKEHAKVTCRTVKERGVSCTLAEEKLLTRRVLSIDLNIPGAGPQKLIQFVESGLFFNVSFNARTEKSLKKSLQLMKQSIETIQVIDKQRTTDREREQEQLFAGVIRIVDLMSNMGRHDEACRTIKKLIVEYPDSADLRASKDGMECK